jgi:hypothetical protein
MKYIPDMSAEDYAWYVSYVLPGKRKAFGFDE